MMGETLFDMKFDCRLTGHFSNIGMFRVHQQNKKMEIVYFVSHLFTGGAVFFKNRTDIISAIIAHLSNIFVHNMLWPCKQMSDGISFQQSPV